MAFKEIALGDLKMMREGNNSPRMRDE